MPNDNRHDKDYFAKLGEFLRVFSNVEAALFFLLAAILCANVEVMKLAFPPPDLSVHQMMQKIIVLLNGGVNLTDSMHHQAGKRRILEALKQLERIKEIRNSIVHHGTFENAAKLVSAPFLRATYAKDFKAFAVSKQVLDDMTLDLLLISGALQDYTTLMNGCEPDFHDYFLILHQYHYKDEPEVLRRENKPSRGG